MLGKCRQPKQASLLFELTWSDGIQPTVDVYTALVSAYGLSGLLDEAFHTLDLMKSVSDCKPDIYTYSILINCCMKFRSFDLVKGLLAGMSYFGVECTAVTYNTIIDGYGKAKLFELTENSLMDMIESDACNPDVFTLNSFIGAYGYRGKIEEMEKWFDEFQIMGIRPDVKTFNILIKSYGKAGMYEKMGSVLEFMTKRFFSPTVVTFNIVIEVFGKSGSIEKMEEFFLKMKHQGMKPTAVTYFALVSAYSKSGLLHRIDSVMRQVENSDVVLDMTFFNCILSAYGQAGEIKKMGELLLAMKERNCKMDKITLAMLMQAYKKQGMIEAAEELEDKMISEEDKSGRCVPSVFQLFSNENEENCLFLEPVYEAVSGAKKKYVLRNLSRTELQLVLAWMKIATELQKINKDSPLARPTMSVVVKMLEGQVEIMPPPKPFNYM
ncbi:hypothetical protein Vadar_010014 [Vaccinium darrowii]|uniref:Uncharacterized protein n=1 Tax=Vaccinium darrowii TaxID=229202 RepID=A0ACB7WZY0_9ERIC|nr:hypothetical protein Vadar_010014 [Vaccinium darrowii]